MTVLEIEASASQNGSLLTSNSLSAVWLTPPPTAMPWNWQTGGLNNN